MIQPYEVHNLYKEVEHKVMYEHGLIATDLLEDNHIIRAWLEKLPAVTVIDCLSSPMMLQEVENGKFPANCGHQVPAYMLLVAIKTFMVTCMKIAMSRELKSKFKGWFATHRFIFLNALDLRKCKPYPSWEAFDLDVYHRD